jgi:hypothetical protein
MTRTTKVTRSSAGSSTHGKALSKLRKKYVFGDLLAAVQVPQSPHDYGRLFVTNAGSHGLNEISQPHVIPGGALSLALLGWGQDASASSTFSATSPACPSGRGGRTHGRVLKLVPAPEADD